MSEIGLFQISNSQGFLLNNEPPRFEPVDTTSWSDDNRGRSIVFVHGANYGSKCEVIRDLVAPFTRASKLHQNSAAKGIMIKLLVWPSEQFPCASWKHALRGLVSGMKQFKTLEWSAFQTSVKLFSDIRNLLCNARSAPIFISHSFGALVMSHLLRHLFVEGIKLPEGSTWLSLQPAIEHCAYSRGARFQFIPGMFESARGRHVVWYSRADMVLGTLYRFYKRRSPMGLWGPTGAGVEAEDLTQESQEAHGTFSWSKLKGNFFDRTESRLSQKMAELLKM